MAFFVGFDGRFIYLYGANAYRIINPPTDGKSGTYDLQLDPGLTQTGTVLGPDGQPLPGVLVSGLRPFDSGPLTLQTATFTVLALNGHDSRELRFLHKERKLGGYGTVRGDEKIATVVKLEPLGTLRGRILDEDGQPRAGVQVQLSYADKIVHRPVQWWDLRMEPATTDKNGCFRIELITDWEKTHVRLPSAMLLYDARPTWRTRSTPLARSAVPQVLEPLRETR